jgi:CHRD domain
MICPNSSFSLTGTALRKIMNKRRGWAALAISMIVTAMLAAVAAGAQGSAKKETFKARLSPVPIDVSMMSTIAGSGSLTATLSGKQLTIQGTFAGLRSPATTAGIHRAPKGIPGPVVSGMDLRVTKDEKGEVSGTLELTAEQIADLKNGLLYVQIQSERAPDGNLWGWVLP